MKKQWIAWFIVFEVFWTLGVFGLIANHNSKEVYLPPQPYYDEYIEEEVPAVAKPPHITTALPGYLSYSATVEQLHKWQAEANDYVEVGTYGTSTGGKDLVYIRLTNKLKTEDKPKVLIMMAIHGNEPLSSAIGLNFAGKLLQEKVSVLDERDIYIIPIVNPDSYPHSRHVNGVDPNRDFDGNSVPPIQALKDFVIAKKFNAVLSGHTGMELIATPPGDSRQKTANDADYRRIAQKMSELTGYNYSYLNEIYGRPIQGGEADWLHRHGALAVVVECGDQQGGASQRAVERAFKQNYEAMLYFAKEAPLVKIQN